MLVDKFEDDDQLKESHFIVEPTEHVKETYPLQMASVLVDVNGSPTSKVRVYNPFPTPVSLKQDAVLGQAEPIVKVQGVLKTSEYPSEMRNNSAIRRVTFNAPEVLRSNPIETECRCAIVNTHENKIPHHLLSLYESAVSNCNEEQHNEVKNLLLRFQNTFSKNDIDLELTYLREHTINTGDAAPVRQAPRRVPLCLCGGRENGN